MSVRKTDAFIADVERQYHWYVVEAGLTIADHYLDTVQATCQLLGRQPLIGPRGGFSHPKLRGWRFFLTLRPFQRHILFYEVIAGDVVMRRAMHGHRDLPRRLLEPGGTE
jgi:plasmid stabilization system protein ParE